MPKLDKYKGFEWNKGNSSKPQKHGLTLTETEEAFFDEDKVIFADWKHSKIEPRITLLAKTKKGRLLNITYTIRARKIRVITARPINKKEKHLANRPYILTLQNDGNLVLKNKNNKVWFSSRMYLTKSKNSFDIYRHVFYEVSHDNK